MLSGHLPTAPLEEQSFAVVYMDQVLEHPKNPGEYLERAHQLLAPGGLLYVGVPNTRSISSRLKSLRDSLGLRAARKRGSHYDTWQHLSYFGPDQLTRALEQSFGFEVLLVLGDPDAGGARWLGWLRSRFPLLESSLLVIARRQA